MTTLKIYRTHSMIKLPQKQTAQSACFDLSFQGFGKSNYEGYSTNNKNFKRPMNNQIIVQPGDRIMVPTGLIMDIPKGYSVRLHARSGASLKQGLVLANAEGVIDSDYVQEVMVLVYNISGNPITISGGDRIAQAELVKDEDFDIVETAVRPILKTDRTGGMGSTGITESAGTITLNIKEPEIPDFVKRAAKTSNHRRSVTKEEVSKSVVKKKGPGRPKKKA
jgi:dUTP pyrophosphatase